MTCAMPFIPIVVSVVVMVTPHRGKQTHTRDIAAAVQEHNRATSPMSVMNSHRSFDHLVGAGEQCVRNLEAERPRGLEVDGQFELRWLLNGKIGRLLALKDEINIRS